MAISMSDETWVLFQNEISSNNDTEEWAESKISRGESKEKKIVFDSAIGRSAK